MAKTGERYGAARRALIEQRSVATSTDAWVSPPEVSDDTVLAATGRGWNEWVAMLDDVAGTDRGHSALAAHLTSHEGVDPWWAQTITVGYERIRGLRLPYQMADGTFTAGRTKTVVIDGAALRAVLVDDDARQALFPGMDTHRRSRPTSKNVRLAMEEGVAEISTTDAGGGRFRVVVAHTKLPSPDHVAIWKDFWSDWLSALDEAT